MEVGSIKSEIIFKKGSMEHVQNKAIKKEKKDSKSFSNRLLRRR